MEQVSNPQGSPEIERVARQGANTQCQGAPSDAELGNRYSAAIDALVVDALKSGHQRILTEVIAWHIAQLTERHGPLAVGLFLKFFGEHIHRLGEIRWAEAEARRAKEEGRRPS